MVKKDKIDEVIDEMVQVDEELKPIDLVTDEFGREDLNNLRDKVNELIKRTK